jgi:hypothetical protein
MVMLLELIIPTLLTLQLDLEEGYILYGLTLH